ncbi:hypothetical protein [Nitrospira sp. BLG_2]|uniref:hypothetical protein n=1 Tax=Nitrospira sp. BLG_2 TaxID=3397507 RepID=UPI003B9B577F
MPLAELVRVPRGRRRLLASDLERVAAADPEGVLTTAEVRDIPHRAHFVCAEGFVSQQVSFPLPAASDSRIVLKRGLDLAVACVGPGDQPVPGVQMTISRKLFQDNAPGEGHAPGAHAGLDPTTALVSATSDDNGIARFRCVAPGRCFYRAEKAGYAAVHRDPTLKVPPVEITLRFVPIRVIVGKLEGEKALTWPYSYSGPPLVESSGALEESLRVRKDLERQYPGAFVTVACSQEAELPPLEVSFLLESGRIAKAQFHFRSLLERPLAQTARPVFVDAPALSWRMGRLRVVDDAGRRVPVGEIRLRVSANETLSFSYSIPVDATARLWVGTHRFEGFSGALAAREALPKEISIPDRENQDIEVRLPLRVQACHVVFEAEDETPIAGGYVTITSANGTPVTHFVPDLARLVFLLPCGSTQIHAKLLGYDEGVRTFDLEESAPEQVKNLTIELRGAAR